MAIERNDGNNEVQQKELQELRQNQVENQLEEASRQGKELDAKKSIDGPESLEQHKDNREDDSSNRSRSLEEKNSIDSPTDEKKRFEDYSNAELQQMREENPYKLENLNADFRERYEAEMYGMSQDEYKDYKGHLSRMNAQKEDTQDKDISDRSFDQKTDQQRIAERQNAFVERLNDNETDTKEKKSYEGDVSSQESYHSSFTDKIKDFAFGKESSYDSDRAEAHGLEKGCFDAVPREYRGAVYEKFENAPDEIKKFVNENAEKISVNETPACEDSYYSNREIYMEKGVERDEYADIFSHEYGHFCDDMNYRYSRTLEFTNAIKNDLKQYDRNTPEGRACFDNMLNDLFSSDAGDDRMISDNLSAYFKNDSEVMECYDNEGAGYYQHNNAYWETYGARESEIYANSFSIYASGNKESITFMEKNFPETWECFKNSLEG